MVGLYLARTILSRALRSAKPLQQYDLARLSSTDAEKRAWTPPTEEELAAEPDPFLRKEIADYARARIKLAEMMGRDPETFTDQDVKDAIQYLFPTSLTMKDARPFLKHPKEIYPAPIEATFGQDGRPLEPAFYMGTPAYFNLKYEIYEQARILERAESSVELDHPETTSMAQLGDQHFQEPQEQYAADSPSSKESSKFAMPDSNIQDDDKLSPGFTCMDVASSDHEDLPSIAGQDTDLEQLKLVLADGVSSDTTKPNDALTQPEEQQVVSSKPLDARGSEEQPFSEGVGPRLGTAQPMKWINKADLSTMLSEDISDERYDDIIAWLTSLSQHPQSHLVKNFLDRFRKPVYSYLSQSKLASVEDPGTVRAHGWRKTSVAEVHVKAGRGHFTVNKRPLIEYFTRVADRNQVLYPLVITNLLGKYDVRASVKGGGLTGQAGAVRLGLSKALVAFPGVHSYILESEGLLIRDPRMVERKKPGQLKARRKFTWVKR